MDLQIYKIKSQVAKALAHESRLMIIDALKDGNLCVQDLTQLIGADQSTVSKQASVLKYFGDTANKPLSHSVASVRERCSPFSPVCALEGRAWGRNLHWPFSCRACPASAQHAGDWQCDGGQENRRLLYDCDSALNRGGNVLRPDHRVRIGWKS